MNPKALKTAGSISAAIGIIIFFYGLFNGWYNDNVPHSTSQLVTVAFCTLGFILIVISQRNKKT